LSGAVTLVWFISMCLGRIYLGTHSPHDLLLGISLAFTLVSIINDEFIEKATKFVKEKGGVGFMALGGYVVAVIASYLLKRLLQSQVDTLQVSIWDDRILKADCPIPPLYYFPEGLSALTGFFAVLMSIILDRMILSSKETRFLGILFFMVTMYLVKVKAPDMYIGPSLAFFVTTFFTFTYIEENAESLPRQRPKPIAAASRYGAIRETSL
jgi:hypothetical protein